jgi:hypothetical protein
MLNAEWIADGGVDDFRLPAGNGGSVELGGPRVTIAIRYCVF